ncbi:MAG: hypothetical protein DMF69_22275 [Acidobacteria bacterium]|nr:MAG: hypothetical protein DMF69_22275 [Acidobacteriota bacterium]
MTASVILGALVALVGSGGIVFGALRFNREEATRIVEQQSTILQNMELLYEATKEERDALQKNVIELRGALEQAREDAEKYYKEAQALRSEVVKLRTAIDGMGSHGYKLRRGVKYSWIVLGIVFVIAGTSIVLGQIYNAAALQKIQNQRRIICEDQNHRHDESLFQLSKAVKQYVKDNPEQAEAAYASQTSNLRIINALVPKRDCDQITKLPL